MGEFTVDPELKKWASKTQAEYIDAINEHGSIRAAARALGKAKSTLDGCLASVRRVAALKGHSPEHHMTHAVPDPFTVKGVSTYFDSEGVARGQWVKSRVDGDRLAEMMRAAADAMAEELPRAKPVEAPRLTNALLLNQFTITDLHLGALAWHKEGGQDYDLRIAEKMIIGCFEQMVRSAPSAQTALVVEAGDFEHYDSLTAVTPEHGNILDSDSRFSKMVSVGIRVMRRVVALALERHQHVHVIIAEGNHNPASAVWRRHMLTALYENEPRVTVNDSELPYYVHQHGKTMIGVHHGHLAKHDRLPLLFAAQYPEIWGSTTKRYIHTGHLHCKEEKEYPGVTLIRHPTLAARDAYASRNGYLSERDATVLTYHSKFGLVARNTVMPEMLDGHDDANSNVIALRGAA